MWRRVYIELGQGWVQLGDGVHRVHIVFAELRELLPASEQVTKLDSLFTQLNLDSPQHALPDGIGLGG